MADPAQRVLVADPPYRLSYTWHAITEEFGRARSTPSPRCWQRCAAEPLSHVRFEIEPAGGAGAGSP